MQKGDHVSVTQNLGYLKVKKNLTISSKIKWLPHDSHGHRHPTAAHGGRLRKAKGAGGGGSDVPSFWVGAIPLAARREGQQTQE